MKCRIIDRDFVDAVASLSRSNQMDTEEQSWGAMCNQIGFMLCKLDKEDRHGF